MNATTEKIVEEEPKGLIQLSLGRSNTQIRKDRGDAIAEDLEIAFKRDVEDTILDLKRLKRDRENMYDFSPDSTHSLVLAKNVDSREILIKDKATSLEIRETEIKLEIAKERYESLFGSQAV